MCCPIGSTCQSKYWYGSVAHVASETHALSLNLQIWTTSVNESRESPNFPDQWDIDLSSHPNLFATNAYIELFFPRQKRPSVPLSICRSWAVLDVCRAEMKPLSLGPFLARTFNGSVPHIMVMEWWLELWERAVRIDYNIHAGWYFHRRSRYLLSSWCKEVHWWTWVYMSVLKLPKRGWQSWQRLRLVRTFICRLRPRWHEGYG